MKMQGSLVLLASLWIYGCTGSGGGHPEPDGGSALSVKIGTGVVDWAPIPASGQLGVVKGPQGGFHFIVNAKVDAMDQPGNPDDPGSTTNPVTTFQAFGEDGGVLNWDLPPYHLGYFKGVSGAYEIGGHILRLQIPTQEFILGQHVRIKVTVEQVNGKTGTDETTVLAIPADQPDGGTDACAAPGC
jgi:hypothetical protein